MTNFLENVRQGSALLATLVVALYIWYALCAWKEVCVSRGTRRAMLWRRIQFSISVMLFVGSMAVVNGFFAVYYRLGSPKWMLDHPIVTTAILTGCTGLLLKVRIATSERFGELPWILTAAVVGLAAWLV